MIYLKILLLLAAAIAIHEFTHYIFAKLFKLNVLSVQLFLWPLLYIYANKTLWKIGFIPLFGYVNAKGVTGLTRLSRFIFFMSAPLVNLLCFYVSCDYVFKTINLYLFFINIIPLKNSDIRNAL